LSYEQVLQELQINRSELNRLIRDGRLKDHVISGETKFRRVEVVDLKKSLQKRPTVMAEEGEGSGEPTTDVLVESGKPKSGEPETQVLEGTPADDKTVAVGKRPAAPQERDTEILEEEGEPALDLEMPADEELELERPLAEATPLSESALETDLELQAVRGKPAAKPAGKEEEDFFDFTEALKGEDFELEGAETEAGEKAPKAEAPKAAAPKAAAPRAAAPKAAAPKAAAPKAAAPKAAAPKAGAPKAGADEAVGDVMALDEEAAGGEVSEEELLSEIMDIEGAEEPEEETADITADITTMEEPTYEATGLEDVLAGGAEEEAAAEEFEVPTGAPIGEEAPVSKLMVAFLVVALVALVVGGLFVLDNGSNMPGYTSGLTSWAMKVKLP
jgi:hypothetical protein